MAQYLLGLLGSPKVQNFNAAQAIALQHNGGVSGSDWWEQIVGRFDLKGLHFVISSEHPYIKLYHLIILPRLSTHSVTHPAG